MKEKGRAINKLEQNKSFINLYKKILKKEKKKRNNVEIYGISFL